MDFSDFKRLIAPISKKIFLLLGRGILKAINNSEGTQKIQVVVLDGEIITDVERFQEYGFETYPLSDSEIFGAFLNANRGHGIVLCVHDRRYRPTDLSEGDVRQYDYRGNKITCKNTGIEIECLNGNKIEMIEGEVKVNGTNLEVLI